jgi:HlyD family secretion protein
VTEATYNGSRKKMTKKRVLLGLLAIVVVAVVVVTALGRNRGDDGLAVEVAAVDRTTVVQTVTATGKIQPMVQVNISADVSAKIIRLGVDEGDWVEKGALLVELDSERYLAEVESQEANLSAAQAQANLARENMVKAEKDYERSRQLFNSSLESQATLDTMYASAEVEKARYQSAQDQVEQAKAAVRQARDALSKTTIYAPMAGTISALNKEVGEIALGSQFQEDVIMVVSNLQGMEALVDVDENDIVLVSVGDEAEIEVDALPDVRFKGQVTEIASSAKVSGQGTGDQRTEFEVKIAITDPGTQLRPGMTASAEVVTDVRDSTLAVPLQCVTVRTVEQLGVDKGPDATEGGEPRFMPDGEGFVEVVWVVENGTAKAHQVKTGIQSETHIEVVEGLTESDQVVVGSYRAISRDLKDGATVRIGGDAEAGGREG